MYRLIAFVLCVFLRYLGLKQIGARHIIFHSRLETELTDVKSSVQHQVTSVQKDQQIQSEELHRLKQSEAELKAALSQRKEDVDRYVIM